MEARDPFRKTQLLDACQVAPAMFEQVVPRLYTFMEPLVTIFHGQGDDQHAKTGLDHGVGHPIAFWSTPWLAAVDSEARAVSRRMPRSQQTSREVSARTSALPQLSRLPA